MNFGEPRKTNRIEDTIEFFIDELENELLLIQIYLNDLDVFLEQKKTSIAAEFKDEEKEIRLKILNQPNYKLYEDRFNDLLTKNVFVTLISKFETSLIEFIQRLKDEKIIKRNLSSSKILDRISFLKTELNLKGIWIDNIELFILLRNKIIHDDSKISSTIVSHNSFGIFEDYMILENDFFKFKNIAINLFLLKEIRTFYNSIASQIS